MLRKIPNSNYTAFSNGIIQTSNWKGSGKTKILKPAKDKKGYLRTVLTIDGVAKTIKIHRIIAIAFIPNPLNLKQVNHKNGIKTDNRVENLEWVTGSQNMKHAVKMGLVSIPVNTNPGKKGALNNQAILTEGIVLQIRSKFRPRIYTREMLAKEYGISPATVKDVVLRKSWNHL